MRTIFIASALALIAAAPASAQTMGGMGGRSCVMNNQFVPCPAEGMMGSGMGPGGMAQPERRMTRREMAAQRRMERQQGM